VPYPRHNYQDDDVRSRLGGEIKSWKGVNWSEDVSKYPQKPSLRVDYYIRRAALDYPGGVRLSSVMQEYLKITVFLQMPNIMPQFEFAYSHGLLV